PILAFSRRGDHPRHLALTVTPIIGPIACHFEKKSFKIPGNSSHNSPRANAVTGNKAKFHNDFGRFRPVGGFTGTGNAISHRGRTRTEPGRPEDPSDRGGE